MAAEKLLLLYLTKRSFWESKGKRQCAVGDDFGESKIYRIRFTDLLKWVLEIPGFEGKAEDSNEGHLEMIQSTWVYEWRDGQK